MSDAASTANSAVISWTDKLLAIATDGIEVQLAYLPRKLWPHEAEENPPNEVWQAWATTVPGTDMCMYGPHKGETPDVAVSSLWDELYKGGGKDVSDAHAYDPSLGEAVHAECGGTIRFEFNYEEYVPLGPDGDYGYEVTHVRSRCDKCGATGVDDELPEEAS